MTLKRYKAKRNFKTSNEPLPIKKDTSSSLRFCVQEHHASHLHYDFRLEHKGVLLSWAIPKGPSLNPKDKRLAVHVEDHPLDYQYFEGVIPKGNYGAGTVKIWDHGTYTVPQALSLSEMEKAITEGLKKGHLEIQLDGEKLQGIFVLHKFKADRDDKSWLLIKKNDRFATTHSTVPLTKKSKTKVTKKLPEFFPPMLATLVDKPYDDPDWVFEIKWDGWRALAFIDPPQIQLKSRSDHIMNEKFPSLIEALKRIEDQVIFDGEIVVLDSSGKSDFQLLQNYQETQQGNLRYCIFDLLFKDGEDLREYPLLERKEILKKYLQQLSLPILYYSDHVSEKGVAFFKAASKHHLEGVIGKKSNGTYQSKRSRDWVKIKAVLSQEVVIGGFTAPRGSRKKFGALLVGVYNKKKELVYTGHVGGGFNTHLLEIIYKSLQPLIQKQSPFHKPPKANSPVTWVKPQLICEVKFAEWTKENIMRQPIFKGMREDKKGKEIKKETPVPLKSKESFLTNLDKVFWPEEGITKGDLIAYYRAIAPYILPYLKNRPIMLHRYPDGIAGKDFYQKDIQNMAPSWIETCAVQHEGKINHYLMINDLPSLLYAINLGSIDLHPFHSRYDHLDYPDYCLIDIDPHDVPFHYVVETALEFHHLLEDLHVPHCIKTSGKKGLHLLIPLHGKYTVDQSRQFAEVIATLVHEKLPKYTSLERSPRKRPKKIYLDCLQNRPLQGIVAPYAVRPVPQATVSTPLEWNEVNERLDIKNYTLKNIPERLKKKGDLFKGILGRGISIEAILKKLR